MATVTIVDRLTSEPLVKLTSIERGDGAIIFSSEKNSKKLDPTKEVLTKNSEILKRRYKKGDRSSVSKLTSETKFDTKKIQLKEPGDSEKKNSYKFKKEKKVSKGREELLFKGADYSVFSLSKGKMISEKKIWFDYMNPPSKKLRKDKYKMIWSKRGCCLWRNGDNYEVVFESNLYFDIGAKKIPVEK